MSDKRASETHTPCFDWVIEATGSQPAALTYGVVWRYAQMAGARCYASCERLAGHLAWTRQSVMRHLRSLRRLGLVVCSNPDEPGVPREYLPVSREHWLAARDPEARVEPQGRRRRGRPGHIGCDGTATDSGSPDSDPPATLPPDSDPLANVPPESRPPATLHADGAALPPPQATEAATGAGAPVFAVDDAGRSLGQAPVTDSDHRPAVAEEHAPSADTPCDKITQPPVTCADTRNTTGNTRKRRGGTAECRDPGLVLLRKLTGGLPPGPKLFGAVMDG
jgi:hypothetical protein